MKETMADNKGAGANPAKKPIYESQESLYKKALQKMHADKLIVQYAYKIDNYKLAAQMFEEVGDFQDAPELAKQCRKLAEEAVKEAEESLYQKAKRHMEDGSLTEIDKCGKQIELLKKLGDYKDSRELLAKCQETQHRLERKSAWRRRLVAGLLAGFVILCAAFIFSGLFKYVLGLGYLKTGYYAEAQAVFESMPGYLSADSYGRTARYAHVASSKTGNVITYGKYHWKVLSKKNGVLTLIAADITPDSPFYAVPFNEEQEAVSWAESSLRTWLNGPVYEEAFDDFERSHLLLQTCGGSENEEYGSAWSEETQDYLTILSVQETGEYMKQLQTLGLNYWLRTPGASEDCAAFMSADHVVRTFGYPVSDTRTAVRPVIQIDTAGLTEEA